MQRLFYLAIIFCCAALAHGCDDETEENISNIGTTDAGNETDVAPVDLCLDVDCGTHGACDEGLCICDAGYEVGSAGACQDTDECETDNGGCGENAQCSNQAGAEPICTCSRGFVYNPEGVCVPEPECLFVECGANSYCEGGACLCDPGYEFNAAGDACLALCPTNSTRQDDATCACDDGFEFNAAGDSCLALCPANSTRQDDETCACDTGTFDSDEGPGTDCATCSECDEGQFVARACGGTDDTTCIDCLRSSDCGEDAPACGAYACVAGECILEARPADTVCRSVAGTCDLAETCDGTATECPADSYKANTEMCRPIGDVCDTAELCTGDGVDCPADAVVVQDTLCREAVGVCDVAELCDGVSKSCPEDGFVEVDTVCREAGVGGCDVADVCDGLTAACPEDALAPAETICRAADGDCDVADVCDGITAVCPEDALAPAETICRASAGACDLAETCDGATRECPADVLATPNTLCREAAGVCDIPAQCDGVNAVCPDNAFLEDVCRASSAPCDVEEQCTGTSADCPVDLFIADGGVSIEVDGDNCGFFLCDGQAASCPLSCLDDSDCTEDATCQGGECAERERPQWTLEILDHFDDHAAIDEGPDGQIYVASKGRGDEWRLHVYSRNAVIERSVAIVGMSEVYDLHVRDDGAAFLAGTNRSGKPAIARLDSDDKVLWAFSLDYIQPFLTIDALADGTIVAGGLRVVLVDPDTGAVLSQRNQSEYGRITDISPAADGGYWATTTTDDNGIAPQFQSLIKVGSDGVGEFGKVVEVSGGSVGEGVAVLTDGSVVVVGGNSGECLVSRFSESASLLWSKLVDGDFGCKAVTGTADGGIVVGGGINLVDPQAMLVKLTADGTVVWSRNYEFNGFVHDVLEGADGALIANSPFPDSNVIRADAEGRTGCESDSAIAPADPLAQARDVLFDVNNEKVVVIESPTVVQIDPDVSGVCGFE